MDLSKLERLSNETLIAMQLKIKGILADRNVSVSDEIRRTIRIGDLAMFHSDRRACNITIKVEKINPKTVVGVEVDEAGRELTTRWKVSPSYLTPVNPRMPSSRTLPADVVAQARAERAKEGGGALDKPASASENHW